MLDVLSVLLPPVVGLTGYWQFLIRRYPRGEAVRLWRSFAIRFGPTALAILAVAVYA
jgi:hypothetical protein